MESEKVKEIKKHFEERAKTGSCLLYKENDELKVIYFADILTLINELESQNKDLQDLCNKTYDDLTKEIDRLENENKDYYDRLNNLQTYIDNHEKIWKGNTEIQLKQFAERLKEKLLYGYFTTYCEVEVYIDETLNEFLKKENNN